MTALFSRVLAVVMAASLLGACATLGPPLPQHPHARKALLPNLAIVEAPAPATAPPGDTFVVFYSGDGGWASFDRGVAGALADKGYPVVGVDSLHYFWSTKTPGGAGADLSRIIETYAAAWGRPRVILVGFSFGASTLPAIASDITPAAAGRVRSIVIMAPRRYIEWVVRPNSWVNIPGRGAYPFEPTLRPLKRWPVLCLHGRDDGIAACPDLDRDLARTVTLPGGHRMSLNADRVSDLIIASPNN